MIRGVSSTLAVRLGLFALVCATVVGGAFSAPASASEENERFVNRLYYDFALAEPTSGQLAWHTAYLDGGGSRSTVVDDLVYAPTFGAFMAGALYGIYVGRPPTSGESSNATTQLLAGDTYSLERSIIGSPEYFSLAGSTNAGFVAKAYADVLRRAPSPSESSYWISTISPGGNTRSWVAGNLIKSSESAGIRAAGPSSTTECNHTEVIDNDALFLGAFCIVIDRMANSSDRSYWAGRLQSNGNDLLALVTSLASSAEYYLDS